MRYRVIPCLLLSGPGLVKTRKFRNPVYIGDPINTARIFSDKEVDEIMLLDIDASKQGRDPDYDLIAAIAGECLMPLAYGGGVKTVDQIDRLIRSGVEKIVINTAATESNQLIQEASRRYGTQAIVGAIDTIKVRKHSYEITTKSATQTYKVAPEIHAEKLVAMGCGEILLNNVDLDGEMTGYDLDLIKTVTNRVQVPVVACGGAGNIDHLNLAINNGKASAVAAGSMFVFYGRHRAVLITYPKNPELTK